MIRLRNTNDTHERRITFRINWRHKKRIRDLEKKRDAAWREYDIAGREIEKQKDDLIDRIEKKLKQQVIVKKLFTIQWKVT